VSPARAAVAAAALAAACAGLLRASEPPPAGAGLDARLDAVERRVARLEARLGVAPRGPAAAGFRARYDALLRREARLADSARAWVPDAPPLASGTITSGYAARRFHPVEGRVMPHWGLDIAAPHGAPVLAAADGEVVATFRSPTYGMGVDVRHGTLFLTRYAHLSALAVRRGERVRRGQRIGSVGATGRTTGPHLHYEAYARRGGGYFSVDPVRLLPPDGPVAP
jgi:murein DD-endopeptidase MepM/ murein hydrolase activator NlpD